MLCCVVVTCTLLYEKNTHTVQKIKENMETSHENSTGLVLVADKQKQPP